MSQRTEESADRPAPELKRDELIHDYLREGRSLDQAQREFGEDAEGIREAIKRYWERR